LTFLGEGLADGLGLAIADFRGDLTGETTTVGITSGTFSDSTCANKVFT